MSVRIAKSGHAIGSLMVCLTMTFGSSCTKSKMQTQAENQRTLDGQSVTTPQAETAKDSAISSTTIDGTAGSRPTGADERPGATPDALQRSLASKTGSVDLVVEPEKATITAVVGETGAIDTSKTVVSLAPASVESAPTQTVVGSELATAQLLPNTTYIASVKDSASGTPIVESASFTTPAKPLAIKSAEIKSDTQIALTIDLGANPSGTEIAIAVFSEQEEGWLNLKDGSLITDETLKWQSVPAGAIDANHLFVLLAKVDATAEPVFVAQSRNKDLVESTESPAVVAHPAGTPPEVLPSTSSVSSGSGTGTPVAEPSPQVSQSPGASPSPSSQPILSLKDQLKELRKTLRAQREDLKPLKLALKQARKKGDAAAEKDYQAKLTNTQAEIGKVREQIRDLKKQLKIEHKGKSKDKDKDKDKQKDKEKDDKKGKNKSGSEK